MDSHRRRTREAGAATAEYDCSWSSYGVIGTRICSFGNAIRGNKEYHKLRCQSHSVLGRIFIKAADDAPANGLRVTYDVAIEIEGGKRPACVAEMIAVHYR